VGGLIGGEAAKTLADELDKRAEHEREALKETIGDPLLDTP